MHCQWILYDQLHTDYIQTDIDSIFLIITHTDPYGPYGRLDFNPHSKLYNYATIKSFAAKLQGQGYKVYCIIATNYQEARKEIYAEYSIQSVTIMKSCEPYHAKHIHKRSEKQTIPIYIKTNTQFLIENQKFQKQFSIPPIMETFYRWMRKQNDILIENGKPIGGKRNFDAENRKFDTKHIQTQHLRYTNIYREEAKRFYKEHRDKQPITYSIPETIRENKSLFPLDHMQAKQALQFFIDEHLDHFGRLEDAMYTQDQLVYHSILSAAINIGLLTPHEVLHAILQTDTAIQNKEGYIRQILGRREYMYHFFTYYKESIYNQNYLKHHIPLPKRFREPAQSPLKMHCIQTTLKTVKEIGYSHHITRLMLIGNFCQLINTNPHDLNKRFREMYTDAYERVVTPNVLSMSQYADGGKLATKPYVASANYVNKMSNHCKNCAYDPNEKYGPNACPLNYLYRRYVDKNKELFIKGRQPFILKHLEKLDMEKIHTQSEDFIRSYIHPTDATID